MMNKKLKVIIGSLVILVAGAITAVFIYNSRWQSNLEVPAQETVVEEVAVKTDAPIVEDEEKEANAGVSEETIKEPEKEVIREIEEDKSLVEPEEVAKASAAPEATEEPKEEVTKEPETSAEPVVSPSPTPQMSNTPQAPVAPETVKPSNEEKRKKLEALGAKTNDEFNDTYGPVEPTYEGGHDITWR